MSNIQKILVPDVGGEEVEIIEICFAVGDTLEADEGIVTVETDKASMDIPAPFAGELASLSVKVGDKIKEGDVIGVREKSKSLTAIESSLSAKSNVYEWLSWNQETLEGRFVTVPERIQIPENINEQFIVELYSK